ncbi:hypothetical protein BDR07DRAFT_1386025 [Suillus spraguei]|nr:hypothetical protein BDR07DRAFT_1386025 [Suillus spraguei]
MAVHIQNPHENCKVEVSPRKWLANALSSVGLSCKKSLSHWKGKAEWFETLYLKRCGVITSDVNVLVHVHPLKGLKHLESGALVKDYEGPEKELEQAVQMVISEVASEDPRFPKKDAPPLSEEFLMEQTFSSLVNTRYDKTENNKFKIIVDSRVSQHYLPSFKAASTIRMINSQESSRFWTKGRWMIDIARTMDIFDSHADAGVKENQRFALGDRVTMVQDSGGVPLSAKGVVIGLNTKSMDVVWDVPFMSGTTLGDRYTALMLTLDDKA